MSSIILNNYSLIKIHGADATDFLQGQLSNDVTLLRNSDGSSSQIWQLTGYCNPKGRLLGLLYLWWGDDGYYALTASSLSAKNVKRLQMYVMRSKVLIEPIENSTIIGAAHLESLEPYGVKIGQNQEISVRNKALTYIGNGWVLGFGGRVMMVASTAIDSKSADIDTDGVSYNWLQADIEDGIPEIVEDTYETFIPQMINLDLLDGVNFKKGCYTGQEIVARMHYLGNLKQRMFICDLIFHDNLNLEIKSGEKVLASDQSNKSAGQIVRSSGTVALAVLRLDQVLEPIGEGKLILENGVEVLPRPDQLA